MRAGAVLLASTIPVMVWGGGGVSTGNSPDPMATVPGRAELDFADHGVANPQGLKGEDPATGWRVRRFPTAKAQLENAKLQKRRIRKARGEGRNQARKNAVRAYRAVREYFPREAEWVAEASFRAGELLRSGGELDSAISEFEHSARTASRGAFRARAGLEVGHIHRRVGRMNEALRSYEEVEALGPDFAEQRDLAAYWQGKVHGVLGRAEDARRCYQRAADGGVDPIQRIRAFDAWADVLVSQGELEGAAGVLDRCRLALKSKAEELSTLGKRVRGALDHMRAPGKLALAVAERRRRRGG